MINSIGIVGLGAIGGMLANHLSHKHQIYIHDPYFTSHPYPLLEIGITKVDWLIICTPPKSVPDIYTQLSQGHSAIISDVSSVKTGVAQDEPNYISIHPICGTDKTGYSSSREINPQGKLCTISSPHPAIQEALESIGFVTKILDNHQHDLIYAYTSHFIQKLAFEVAPLIKEFNLPPNRLCNSNPALWEEIFDLNAKNIAVASEAFYENQKCDTKDSIIHNLHANLEEFLPPQYLEYVGTGYLEMLSWANKCKKML